MTPACPRPPAERELRLSCGTRSTTSCQQFHAGAKVSAPATYPPFFNWHPIGDDIPARVIDFESEDGSATQLEGRRDLHTPMIIPTRLGVDVWEHHDHLRIDARWDGKLYGEDRVVRILEQMTDALCRIAASKAQRVGELWSMGKEGQEGSTNGNLTSAITDTGTRVQQPSDGNIANRVPSPWHQVSACSLQRPR